MKSRKGVLVTAIMLLCFMLVFSACNAQRRPGPVEPTPTPAPSTPAPSPQMQPSADYAKANAVAKKISEMPEINAATVVLSGERAWVGVDLEASVGGKLTDKTKTDITNLVKKEVSGIKTVYVTADADLVTRIRNVANDLGAGKPISGFANELEEIGRRVTPSVK